ncbi:MAG: aminoacyl-tRNA hydrolase [Acidimicrobiia bacterium]
MGRAPTRERTGTAADLLVVGLGNPGSEYAHTRHNVGTDAIELLAKRYGARLRKGNERALVDEVRVGDARIALAIPMTFMNESGEAVQPLMRRYGATPERLLIVHDELDLPTGVVRLKVGGGLAGHNGLRSIVAHCKTDAFLRARIGIGKPVSKEQGANHVLARFGKQERAAMDEALERCADAVECIVREGIDVAMNRYNEVRGSN